jgi:hypothetical protein
MQSCKLLFTAVVETPAKQGDIARLAVRGWRF